MEMVGAYVQYSNEPQTGGTLVVSILSMIHLHD
jgi:hypothetical protein